MVRNKEYKPEPFSGEYWGIVPEFLPEHPIPGLIGTVEVVNPWNYGTPPERLYNAAITEDTANMEKVITALKPTHNGWIRNR